MEIAFITPIDDLGYDMTGYHMALTHLILKYPKYTEFYKQKLADGEYVILDNSLIVFVKATEEERYKLIESFDNSAVS